ncbi:hypothetical protein N7470_005613 [Penicillium chermesinum]|nr:hypothetical protein N7470_005613 [Penicillium chermesinum]
MAFLSYASDFKPLFQLLDDYETHRSGPTSRRTFAPAFDVRELDDGYYLDGELPGADQSNINIEFSDPTTLVIKGHIKRDYQDHSSTKKKAYHATVEDESNSESTETNSVTSDASGQTKTQKTQFWASERSVGDFQRTFTFPTRVDQDAVRASLKNGILSLVVPKDATPHTKKIRIE